MTVNFSVPKTSSDKSKPFYKLMGSELRQMYEAKLLDAPAYVLLIVKTQRAAGWKWTFKIKDFCEEWGINERTFYRAVSKLKSMGLLNWETNGIITVWHGSDIAKSDSPAACDDSPTDTHDSYTDTDDSESDIDVSTVPAMSEENAETPIALELCASPDLIRSSTDSTESVEEDIDTAAATSQPLDEVVPAASSDREKAIKEVNAIASRYNYLLEPEQRDNLNALNEKGFVAFFGNLAQFKAAKSRTEKIRGFNHALAIGIRMTTIS